MKHKDISNTDLELEVPNKNPKWLRMSQKIEEKKWKKEKLMQENANWDPGVRTSNVSTAQ